VYLQNGDDNMSEDSKCISCGRDLVTEDNLTLCPQCNSEARNFTEFTAASDSSDYVFIECPGATLYEPGTTTVIQGVEFGDSDDPNDGYRIVGKAVYAPTHTRLRRIKPEAKGHIRRCQGCQDYTIRMRRPEGPDFFIPSSKYPGRKKLKSISHRSMA
jgi:hypothetical protein